MDVLEALKSARNGDLASIYLFVGEERFLADRAVALIRRRTMEGGIEGFNEDLFQGKGLAGRTVLEAAQTMPMMADRRFVLVRNLDDMAAGELDAFAEYFTAPSPSSVVVLIAEKLDGRSRFVKAAKKHGSWIDATPLKPASVRSFAVAESKERGHRMASDAADALVDAVGTDLAATSDALERLSLFVGANADITLAAVEACVTRVRTESVWVLVDAVSQRNARRAVGAAGSLLADREPPLKILALVSRQFRMLAKMREALAEGLPSGEAARRAGAPPFKADELASAAKRFKFADLERAFRVLSDTDLALKGSKRPGGIVLEEAILALCRA